VTAALEAAAPIGIVGGMYSVESGEVAFVSQPVQTPAPAATMAAGR
jgi:hypothetical protein